MSKTQHNRTWLTWALIAAVVTLSLCLLKSCGKKPADTNTTVTHTVTRWITKTIRENPKPVLISEQPKLHPKAPLASGNCDTVKEQFNDIAKEFDDLSADHSTLRTYTRKQRVDSSTVTLVDSVQGNKLIGGSITFDLKYPHTTTTIDNTVMQKPKRQVYIGGGLASVNKLDGMSMNAGLLYKNRRDNIAGLSIGVDNTGNVLYGFNAYWKIRISK